MAFDDVFARWAEKKGVSKKRPRTSIPWSRMICEARHAVQPAREHAQGLHSESRIFHFFEESFLFFVQLGGHGDGNVNIGVAPAVAVHAGHAITLHPEFRMVLGARGILRRRVFWSMVGTSISVPERASVNLISLVKARSSPSLLKTG